MKKDIKIWVSDKYADILKKRDKSSQIRKFRDPRRLKIANQFQLSKEQKEQIDELFVTNYGSKIDYVWHQNYAAHSGRFDYRYFPELLFIPEFEAYQNQNISAVRMLGDKNFLPIIAKAAGVKMPRTIISCTNGFLRDGENQMITEQMANELLNRQSFFFVKPSVDSSSGKECIKVSCEQKYVVKHNKLIINNVMEDRGYIRDFVVQELVECHDSIKKLHPSSVNTFRVISYLWCNKVELMPIIIRIGQGGNCVDNAHAGGMFCAVNNDGTMGGHAVTEFNQQYVSHPDTNVAFVNHKIEHIESIIEAVKRMHSYIPQIGVVNWDFTIDKEGNPVLIEANTEGGSVWLPQMAHGVGAFGNHTKEVLQWLRFMNRLKAHERVKYVGGLM